MTITNNTQDILLSYTDGKSSTILKAHIIGVDVRPNDSKPCLLIRTSEKDYTVYYADVTSPVTTSIYQLRDLITAYAATVYTASATDTFVNGDLAAGILTITHNLGSTTILVAVIDNTSTTTVYSATVVDASSCTIDLSAIAPITGTWTWMVFKA